MSVLSRVPAVLILFALSTLPGFAADGAVRSLLMSSGNGAAPKISASNAEQVKFMPLVGSATGAVSVTILAGKDGYPGIVITPVGGDFDLSSFGRIEASLTNPGPAPLTLSLRVDNDGDWKTSPWSTENITLQPGATGTLTVHFGYSYGKPGFKLKPEAISKVMIFTGKVDIGRTFRLDALQAGGVPGEKPSDDPKLAVHKPENGFLLGAGVKLDAAAQLELRKLTATLAGDGTELLAEIPAGSDEASVLYKPAAGRWDLRDAIEVRVKVRNSGDAPAKVKAQLKSATGTSDWSAVAELAAGADGELIIPFFSASIWNGEKDKGTQFVSDKVLDVSIAIEAANVARKIQISSIRADVPAPSFPDWLGKRPPVPGDWKVTLDENFDGTTVDATKWDITGENYWDKASHFSKDNVIVGGGVAKIRFEKRRGRHNDDPTRQETDYAVGFLTGFGKFTQRYGYFEARMKLPTAPGLWPAFWMMPDRGPEAGIWWKRGDTGNGGMEFDIMEHLTRWGPYRYNIAMHWDGYGKEHKATGTDKIYVQPDKDGFITAGLLWQKGLLVYYNNGHEVLRWENSRVSEVPEHVMFTLPCGGWDNSPLDDAKLPDDFAIDYVRVWQLNEAPAETKKPAEK